MNKFYVTFAPTHPLRNGWVEVCAYDYEEAVDTVQKSFGLYYDLIRHLDQINFTRFPKGKYGETLYS